MTREELDAYIRVYNLCFWYYYGEQIMAKTCKFCKMANGYVCEDFQDCDVCGMCAPMSKEDKESGPK